MPRRVVAPCVAAGWRLGALLGTAPLALAGLGLQVILLGALLTPSCGAHAESPADLFALMQSEQVVVEATGHGVKLVRLTLASGDGQRHEVLLAAGTLFEPDDVRYQEMVAIETTRLSVPATGQLRVLLRVACGEIGLDVPTRDIRFTIRRSPRKRDVHAAAILIDRQSPEWVIAQAAVWITANDADHSYMVRKHSAVTPGVTAGALQLLAAGGIRIAHRSAFEHWYQFVFHGAERPRQWALRLGEADARVEIVQSVRWLMESGVDVTAADPRGRHLLGIATRWPESSLLTLLLDAGADPNLADRRGRAALGRVSAGASRAIVRGSGMTPLHLTAIHGSLAAANALLASGAGLAATTGELEIERDRSAIVFSRLDALHLAAAADNPAIVAALLERGLQPSADPRTGVAPIHLAAWLGATESAVLLLDRGSPLTTLDAQGWSPMHHAAAGGCVEMIALLRARRSSLDEIGRDGASPLHVAAANGRSAVVRQLLALGARRSLRDARSETPYELTRRMLLTKEVLLSRRWRSEYDRIEKLLRPRGANAPSKT